MIIINASTRNKKQKGPAKESFLIKVFLFLINEMSAKIITKIIPAIKHRRIFHHPKGEFVSKKVARLLLPIDDNLEKVATKLHQSGAR